MKITKKVPSEGTWAKINQDFKDGDRIKILDAGKSEEGDFGPRMVFKILTKSKQEFKMSFNRTSLNNLVDAWGEDTQEWVDKVVKVFAIKQMIGNALKNVTYLAPEDWVMDEDGKFHSPTEDDDEGPF